MGTLFVGLLVILFNFYSLTAFCEYRAFRLNIISPGQKNPRVVISTLDHLQYKEYYSVKESETVIYTETWRCPGRTSDFKEICKSPEDLKKKAEIKRDIATDPSPQK